MIYELIISEPSGAEIIKGTDENGNEYWIPEDDANPDYQAYLESLQK